MGKKVFTILGSVAEMESSMIVERVKAGLRNAKAKGRRLGRPRMVVDPAKITALRAAGLSWAKIAKQMGWRGHRFPDGSGIRQKSLWFGRT